MGDSSGVTDPTKELRDAHVLLEVAREREDIIAKYDKGHHEGLDKWEDPAYEFYHNTDRYGFIHDSRLPRDRDEVERRQIALEGARTDKWLKMTLKWHKTISNQSDREKLTRRVYKGVPHCLRGRVWSKMLNVEDMMENQRGIYEDMRGRARLSSPDIRQIDLDVNRTYRNHIMFRERYGIKQQELFHVLAAYSMYNTEVGYCQGMSGITALLLMYLTEEEAFWALSQLLTDRKHSMHGLFIPGFPKLLRFQDFFVESVLKKFLPKVYKYLDKNGIPPSLYALKWFMQCFLDRTPFTLTLRLWDIFIFEGDKVMIPMAFNIFKLHKRVLLKMSMEKCVNFLQQELEHAFGYSDDVIIDSLKACMLELHRARMDLPPRPADLSAELPTKPFGSVNYPTITEVFQKIQSNSDRTKVTSMVDMPPSQIIHQIRESRAKDGLPLPSVDGDSDSSQYDNMTPDVTLSRRIHAAYPLRKPLHFDQISTATSVTESDPFEYQLEESLEMLDSACEHGDDSMSNFSQDTETEIPPSPTLLLQAINAQPITEHQSLPRQHYSSPRQQRLSPRQQHSLPRRQPLSPRQPSSPRQEYVLPQQPPSPWHQQPAVFTNAEPVSPGQISMAITNHTAMTDSPNLSTTNHTAPSPRTIQHASTEYDSYHGETNPNHGYHGETNPNHGYHGETNPSEDVFMSLPYVDEIVNGSEAGLMEGVVQNGEKFGCMADTPPKIDTPPQSDTPSQPDTPRQPDTPHQQVFLWTQPWTRESENHQLGLRESESDGSRLRESVRGSDNMCNQSDERESVRGSESDGPRLRESVRGSESDERVSVRGSDNMCNQSDDGALGDSTPRLQSISRECTITPPSPDLGPPHLTVPPPPSHEPSPSPPTTDDHAPSPTITESHLTIIAPVLSSPVTTSPVFCPGRLTPPIPDLITFDPQVVMVPSCDHRVCQPLTPSFHRSVSPQLTPTGSPKLPHLSHTEGRKVRESVNDHPSHSSSYEELIDHYTLELSSHEPSSPQQQQRPIKLSRPSPVTVTTTLPSRIPTLMSASTRSLSPTPSQPRPHSPSSLRLPSSKPRPSPPVPPRSSSIKHLPSALTAPNETSLTFGMSAHPRGEMKPRGEVKARPPVISRLPVARPNLNSPKYDPLWRKGPNAQRPHGKPGPAAAVVSGEVLTGLESTAAVGVPNSPSAASNTPTGNNNVYLSL